MQPIFLRPDPHLAVSPVDRWAISLPGNVPTGVHTKQSCSTRKPARRCRYTTMSRQWLAGKLAFLYFRLGKQKIYLSTTVVSIITLNFRIQPCYNLGTVANKLHQLPIGLRSSIFIIFTRLVVVHGGCNQFGCTCDQLVGQRSAVRPAAWHWAIVVATTWHLAGCQRKEESW